MRNPTAESCSCLITTQVEECCKSLHKVVTFDQDVKHKLEECDCHHHQEDMFGMSGTMWERELQLPADKFVKLTCCELEQHPDLAVGLGKFKKNLFMMKFDCMSNLCKECGTERN